MTESVFKYRGYTPIPFLIVAIIWANPKYDLMIFGAILIGAGELLRLAAISYTGLSTRAQEIAVDQLVTNGPFAYLRNPMYFGNILIYTGASILSGAWLPYLLYLMMIVFSLQYHICVRYEESALSNAFGEDYLRYAELVPRFFPRLSAYPDKGNIKPDIMGALRSEKSSLLSIAGFVVIILTIYYMR